LVLRWVKTMMRDRSAMEQRFAMMVLMMLVPQAEAARPRIPKKAAAEDLCRALLLDGAPLGGDWLG
jgi:hypothetical protein